MSSLITDDSTSKVSILTPHSKLMLDIGRDLFLKSISTSQESTKFMITLSTSAIPMYLGLLNFILPDNFTFVSIVQKVIVFLPFVIFLVATVILATGLFPKVETISIEVIEEIENAYNSRIKRREKFLKLGFTAFILGTLLSAVLLFWLI